VAPHEGLPVGPSTAWAALFFPPKQPVSPDSGGTAKAAEAMATNITAMSAATERTKKIRFMRYSFTESSRKTIVVQGPAKSRGLSEISTLAQYVLYHTSLLAGTATVGGAAFSAMAIGTNSVAAAAAFVTKAAAKATNARACKVAVLEELKMATGTAGLSRRALSKRWDSHNQHHRHHKCCCR